MKGKMVYKVFQIYRKAAVYFCFENKFKQSVYANLGTKS